MALKATVVSQATHLPPALGAANLAALVDAAASLLSEGEPKGRASLAFRAGSRRRFRRRQWPSG